MPSDEGYCSDHSRSRGAPRRRRGAGEDLHVQDASGNIGCLYDSSPSFLRCDIRSGLKPPPPRPGRCDLDWGDSVSLGRTGRTKLVCHGDTALLPSAPVLAYGKTWKRGPFSCTSRRAGLTCENAADHGFFLSRKSWRRF